MKHLLLSIVALLLAVFSFAQGPITGTFTVCIGGVTTLSDAVTTGTWTSGNPAVATIGASSGTLTAHAAGTATISYTTTGAPVAAVVTVNPLPAAITGTLVVCVGSTTTAIDATPGGTWSDPASAIYATIGASTGVITGITTGVANITYTAPTGCSTSASVTINPLPPLIASSTGSFNLCDGTSLTLGSSPIGVWSGTPVSIATIGTSSGLVSGTSAGLFSATYTNTFGCSATAVVTVNVTPAPITGPLSVPVGGTGLYGDITAGGMWSSDNPLIVSINAMTGVATGNSPGTAMISYCITATGCCNSTGTTASPGLAIAPVSNEKGTISIFPNPTNGMMTLQWSDQRTGKVEVFITDITGRKVFSSQLKMLSSSGSRQLKLNGLGSGMYLMHFRSEGINHTERIIVQ